MLSCFWQCPLQVCCFQREKEGFKRESEVHMGLLNWLGLSEEQMSANTKGQTYSRRCLFFCIHGDTVRFELAPEVVLFRDSITGTVSEGSRKPAHLKGISEYMFFSSSIALFNSTY